MATFNITGMCIGRDVFSLVPSGKNTVQRFLQWTHPIVDFVYNSKPDRLISEEDLNSTPELVAMPNFKKKCILNDYNRTVLEYFQNPADFFLLDLVPMAHTYLMKEQRPDGGEHYFTYSGAMMEALRAGLKERFFADRELKVISPLKALEMVDYRTVLDAFIRWLLEDRHYRADQIIIMESRSVQYYTDGQSLFELNVDIQKQNQILRDMYAYFEERCPGCHVIKMPYGVYADQNHVWGLTDLHYCIEFYEYVSACLQAITEDAPHCAQKIDRLHEDYTRILTENMCALMKNSFQYVSGKQWLQADGFLRSSVRDALIAPRGTPYFQEINGGGPLGILTETLPALPYGMNNAKITVGGNTCYVSLDQCCPGYTGTEQYFGGGWYTMNPATEVRLTDHSAIVCHNGKNSGSQVQILQVVEDNQKLAGQPVVFSVYARVLKKNSQGQGGTIALIHGNGYNKGAFFVQRAFVNEDWKRIFCSARLPDAKDFKGLTVCLRSLTFPKGQNAAVVEFRSPKLEIGSFPTALQIPDN